MNLETLKLDLIQWILSLRDFKILAEIKRIQERSLESLETTNIAQQAVIEKNEQRLNLTLAIERRFARFGDFELPTIAREPLRDPPHFEEWYDYS
ncbi:MAG: plasmid stability protein [Cyanobacteriota bacterium]|nr:plasmid stability protein [Cyanobacteriota bacterium]